MELIFPCYLQITSAYLVVTSCYLVVTSGYLIATTGHFSSLLVTSRCFWFPALVTTVILLTDK